MESKIVLLQVQMNLHDVVDAYYDQEWRAYQSTTRFEGDGDDDDDDSDYDYAPAA